jgi:hypothetical protein
VVWPASSAARSSAMETSVTSIMRSPLAVEGACSYLFSWRCFIR